MNRGQNFLNSRESAVVLSTDDTNFNEKLLMPGEINSLEDLFNHYMSLDTTRESQNASSLENAIRLDLARTDVRSGLYCDESD